MNHYLKDFRAALYSLSRRMGFVVIVILTLSLTLGAFITMVTLNYTVLIKPLPYPEQSKLFVVQGERYDKGELLGTDVLSYAGTVDAYKKNQVFSETAMMHYEEQLIDSISGQPKLFTTYTTPELFTMTGAQMAVGRYFDGSEGLNAHAPVAVITFDTWQKHFAGKTDILTQKVQINDISYKIIGVLDKNYIEPMLYQASRNTGIWLPFDYNSRDEDTRRNWTTGFIDLKLVGKLITASGEMQANQYFTSTMNDRYVEEVSAFSWGKDATMGVTLRSFEEIIVGSSRRTSLMLLAGVFALLLIACANISNLFLSRAAEKQRQYAIQATLGAQKYHIFRSIFIESFILTFTSTVFALIFSQLSFTLLQQHAQGHLARLTELSLSPVIYLFSFLLACLLASIFAVIISNLIDYKALNTILRSSGKGSGLQISKRARDILIISQVALAGILLTGNFTLLKGSMEVINQPSGFKTDDVLWVSLDSGAQQLNRDERIVQIDSIVNKLKQMPEVNIVSNSIFPPLVVNSWTSILTETLSGTSKKILPNVNLVDEHYLTTFGIPLVAGRNFTAAEIKDSQKVIIINETVAKTFGSQGEVLGKNLFWEGKETPYKVVGIAQDIHIPHNNDVPQMFVGRTTSMTFMIGLHPNQELNKNQLIQSFRSINKNLRINSFTKVDDNYQDLLARDISTAVITILLSLLTLLLAGLGIYGVISYSIKLRTYELGVRMALGGAPNAISKLVFINSGRPVLIGFTLSIVLLAGIYIYLIQQTDINTSIEVSALLASFILISVTSIVACFIPLRKIIQSQPIKALR
jgi:predicted permease